MLHAITKNNIIMRKKSAYDIINSPQLLIDYCKNKWHNKRHAVLPVALIHPQNISNVL